MLCGCHIDFKVDNGPYMTNANRVELYPNRIIGYAGQEVDFTLTFSVNGKLQGINW